MRDHKAERRFTADLARGERALGGVRWHCADYGDADRFRGLDRAAVARLGRYLREDAESAWDRWIDRLDPDWYSVLA